MGADFLDDLFPWKTFIFSFSYLVYLHDGLIEYVDFLWRKERTSFNDTFPNNKDIIFREEVCYPEVNFSGLVSASSLFRRLLYHT